MIKNQKWFLSSDIIANSINNASKQGLGIGGRGVYPLARKILKIPPLRILKKYTPPPRRREAPSPFFGQNSKINVNLTEFRLNLVKLTLI